MPRKSRKSKLNSSNEIVAHNNKPKFVAGGYVRLSVKDKNQNGDSIINQQAIIYNYISKDPNITLYKMYTDYGISGQNFLRKSFNQMIEDLKVGKINCCIVKDLSRLGRNAIDTGYYIEKFFPINNIRFISIMDNYDSELLNNEGILIGLKNILNESYSLEVGRKSMHIKKTLINKGMFVGRLAPYGYLKDKNNKHKLIPDPVAAPIIKQIFEFSKQGKTASEITAQLNTLGILTPINHFMALDLVNNGIYKKTHWNINIIYNILKNQVYCGDMVQGKTQSKSRVKNSVPKKDWIIVNNTHEAIISRKLFEDVQLAPKKATNITKKNKTNNTRNLFYRKIYCGHCGYTLKHDNRNIKGSIYSCTTNRLYVAGDCVSVKINENEIVSVLLEIINKFAYIYNDNNSLLYFNKLDKEMAELKKLKTQINKNSKLIKVLYESYVNEEITLNDYKDKAASYKTKIKETADKYEILSNILYSRKKGSKSTDIRIIDNLSYGIVNKLIEKIIIYQDNSIKINFNFLAIF